MIFAKEKTGKTSAVAALANNLILDFEKGTDFLDALKIKISSLEELKEYGELILKQGRPYRYITVDTVTKLEDLALVLAKTMYMNTPIGRNFQEDNILSLSNGGGYFWLREAMNKLLDYIETLGERIIYIGHVKTKYIEKNGKEVVSAEIDLTGKIKSMLSASCDAVGLLYRENNQNIISFKTTDEVTCGARPEHLKNRNIVLSEMIEDKLIAHWDKIYVD